MALTGAFVCCMEPTDAASVHCGAVDSSRTADLEMARQFQAGMGCADRQAKTSLLSPSAIDGIVVWAYVCVLVLPLRGEAPGVQAIGAS